jgi:hypothetical protein
MEKNLQAIRGHLRRHGIPDFEIEAIIVAVRTGDPEAVAATDRHGIEDANVRSGGLWVRWMNGDETCLFFRARDGRWPIEGAREPHPVREDA